MAFVHAITMAGPGDASRSGLDRGARSDTRSWRGCHRRACGRAQPGRPLPARGPLSTAARRVSDPRPRMLGADRRAWAARCRAGASATQVCALMAGGGYAEYVCGARRLSCCPFPLACRSSHAAGLPEAACTVWSTVFRPPACCRRDAARARRHQRHRHLRDPTRACAGRAGSDDSRDAGQVRAGGRAWCRAGGRLSARRLRLGDSLLHGRRGR